MSSFTFILHMPGRFYGFCKFRILRNISRPQIKAAPAYAAPKSWKIAYKPRLLNTTLRYYQTWGFHFFFFRFRPGLFFWYWSTARVEFPSGLIGGMFSLALRCFHRWPQDWYNLHQRAPRPWKRWLIQPGCAGSGWRHSQSLCQCYGEFPYA